MSDDHHDGFFSRLITPLLGQIERLARATQGEHSVDDLKAEAWLAAHEIQQETGKEFEPEDAGFREAIFSRLQRAFGKFVNRAFRFAVRLDEDRETNEGDTRQNSVAASLAAPANYEPEARIEAEEEDREREERLDERFAEAIAYWRALAHVDDRHEALAAHLAIPPNALRRRLDFAIVTLQRQPSLFDGVETISADFRACAGMPLLSMTRQRWPWRNACSLSRHAQLRIFHSMPSLLGRRT